jgi:hypothetical protein
VQQQWGSGRAASMHATIWWGWNIRREAVIGVFWSLPRWFAVLLLSVDLMSALPVAPLGAGQQCTFAGYLLNP